MVLRYRAALQARLAVQGSTATAGFRRFDL
jgi:hypothetical protein